MADIWSFIAETSPERADAFVRRIEDSFEPLRHFPEMGPSRDSLARGLRAHVYGKYVMYYRVTDTALTVVRVVHGARDQMALSPTLRPIE